MSQAMMTALVLEQPYHLTLTKIPVPRVPQGYALVKIQAISVCGSDIHAYKGNSLLLTYPRVLGHELCGVVEQLNTPSEQFAVGDKVSVVPYLACGRCVACRKGRENCCTSLQVLGVHTQGGIADYVSVPVETLVRLPEQMEPKLASLLEPLAVSAHAVRRGGVKAGDRVLVLGAGPIGLGVAEVARVRGAHVRMADVSPARRSFVRERFDYLVMDPTAPDFDEQLREWTQGDYPEKVFDSTGSKASNCVAINYLAAAGDLIYVGLQSDTLGLSDPAFHIREATVHASRVAQKEDFDFVLKQVLSGAIRADRMITNLTDLAHVKESFEDWVARGAEVFKGVIEVK